jgi:hypothetical protein
MGEDRMRGPYGLKTGAAVIGITLLLLLPAFWNGYPIFYFDSLDYVMLPYTWKIPIFRTAGYGVFATIELPFHSVWPLIVAQSALLAYILVEARRILFPHLTTRYSLIVLTILMLFSGMPWLASTAMPDVFTVPSVLLTMMLAQMEVQLGTVRRVVFVLILAIACAAHPTHFALCIGLIICIFVFDKLAAYGWPFQRMHVRYAAIGVALGIAFTAAANWMATGKVFLTPRTTAVLTLAVLIEKGLVQEFLDETCVDPAAHKSILCEQRARLPYDANEFLWHNPDFQKVGGWEAMIKEAPWMLDEIIDRHPIEFVRMMGELTLEQIVTFKTGEGFRTMVGFIDLEIRTYFANENAAFMAARQQSYKEVSDSPMDAINRIQVPAMLASLPLILAVIVLAWRQNDRRNLTISGLITLAYLGNSFICGAISNPADRYNNRIVWLVMLTVLALLPLLTKNQIRKTGASP